jgi:putative ABC transport system permease protein
MFNNYFKSAWRNLLRNKTYSAINILGLSIGMAVALQIGLWVSDELSYNKSFDHYDRLARLMENSTNSGTTNSYSSMPIPLAADLKTKFGTDFKSLALVSDNDVHILAFGQTQLAKAGTYVQAWFPEMLTLKMLQGSRTGLSDPSSLLLSRTLAKAIFGNADPINKILKLDNKTNLKVAGVFEDFAFNSEFREVSFLAPWENYVATNSWVKRADQDWDDNSWQIYAELTGHSTINVLSAKINSELNGHGRKDKPEIFLHPMSQWHLYSEFKNGKIVGGRIQFVWLFSLIGFFVLLLACINFMNLSTARSEKRSKEIGIRKAIGSLRKQLIIQFLSESVLLAFISFFLAIAWVQISLSWFNHLADKQMLMPWSNPFGWLVAISFCIFTGLISGSYPALFLSSFNPIKVLKGSFKAGRLAVIPRKILVVLQFSVSVCLISGTIIVFEQIQFAKNRPIGYNRDGLLTVKMSTPDLYGHYGTLRSDLIHTGAVENMAESSSPTTAVWSNWGGFDWKGKDPNILPSFGVIAVTHDAGNTLGWQFKEGRDFSHDFATDTGSIILNEAAANYMGFSNPIGETIKSHGGNYGNRNFKVIGVIRNLVMESPFDPIKPTLFFLDYEWANVIMVRINPKMSVGAALAKIEPVFRKYNPGSPFDFNFADLEYAKKFDSEERIGKLASFFAVLAIFISCLGLFGLASFMAEQRNKEIGVRKVLGASVFSVWALLSKEFLLLVLISFLIAIPVSYSLMENWLGNYTYRTAISWLVFVLVGTGALLITLMTVGFQAIKAALSNPVIALRSE